jgi:CheY-like chemotaxis protein
MYEADAFAEISDSKAAPASLGPVVEQEPLIRQLVSTVLRRRGWTVSEARDGSVALSVVGAGSDAFAIDHEMRAVLGIRLAEVMGEPDDEVPGTAPWGRRGAERSVSSPGGRRTAIASKPIPVEELVAATGSIGD